MKKLVFALSFIIGVGTLCAAEQKIALVDFQKAFTEFNKSKEAEAMLKDRLTAFKKEGQEMMNEYQKMVDEATKLRDQAEDKTLSEATRVEKKKALEVKAQDIRGIERKIKEYEVTRGRQLEDQNRRMRQGIVEEVTKGIQDFSKDKYSLVLDKSALSLNGANVILYTQDVKDVTDEVVKLLNSKAPEAKTPPAPVKK